MKLPVTEANAFAPCAYLDEARACVGETAALAQAREDSVFIVNTNLYLYFKHMLPSTLLGLGSVPGKEMAQTKTATVSISFDTTLTQSVLGMLSYQPLRKRDQGSEAVRFPFLHRALFCETCVLSLFPVY